MTATEDSPLLFDKENWTLAMQFLTFALVYDLWMADIGGGNPVVPVTILIMLALYTLLEPAIIVALKRLRTLQVSR